MDGQEDAGEVQQGGEDGLHRHVGVGGVHILRHEEGRRAHDGGHDLPAGGSRRLHCPGELALIAGPLHHGDGDGAGGDSVAHRGAGHHAAEGGGDDRHLGGAAGGAARQGVGEVNEEIGDARPLQERAEDDEHGDELGADLDGRRHDAGGAVEQGVDDPGQVLPAGEGVDQQRAHHAQDGQAHAAAAELRQDEDCHHADDQIEPGVRNGALAGGVDFGGAGDDHDQGVVVEAVIEEGPGPQQHQHNVIPGHGVGLHMVLPGGVGEIAHDGDKPQEGGQADGQVPGAAQGHPDAVQGEEGHDHAHDQLGLPLPDAGGGLPVKLAHDLVHVRRGADFHVGKVFLVFLAHRIVLLIKININTSAKRKGSLPY